MNWEDEIVTVMIEIVKEVRRKYPVRGKWHVPKSTNYGAMQAVSLWV